jgi:hypothetical protein
VEPAERTLRPLVAVRRTFTALAVTGTVVLLSGILLAASPSSKDLWLAATVCASGLWLMSIGLWFRRKTTRAITAFLRRGTPAADSELP